MDVFKYKEYQAVIKDYLHSLPKKGFGASQKLAQYLRIHPTQLSQILASQKDLTVDQALAFTQYVGFAALETEYFITLVHWARANTVEAKKYFHKKIQDIIKNSQQVSSRVAEKHDLTEVEQSIFYSSWIYSAIRLYCSFNEGQTMDSLENKFELSRNQISEIIQFLIANNLCREENQRFYIGPTFTYLERSSPFLVRHHLNWRNKAMQKMDRTEEEELFFTGPISLNQEDFLKIKTMILDFISEATQVVKASPADQLACLNIDLFKI